MMFDDLKDEMKLSLLFLFLVNYIYAQDEASNQVEQNVKIDKVSVQKSATLSSNLIKTSVVQKKNNQFLKRISLKAVIGYESNFQATDSYDQTTGITAEAFIGYKINDDYRVSLFLSGEKGFSQGREEITRDSRLSLVGKTYDLYNKTLSFTPSIIGVIPTSETSRNKNKLNTAIELNGNLNYKLNESFSFTYMTRVNKNFHQYQTNSSGEILTDYSLLHFMFVSYSYSEQFSFNPGLICINAWNYNATQNPDSYLAILDLTYTFNSKIALSLGTRTGGQVIDNERGDDQQIQFIDEKSTTAYFNLSKLF